MEVTTKMQTLHSCLGRRAGIKQAQDRFRLIPASFDNVDHGLLQVLQCWESSEFNDQHHCSISVVVLSQSEGSG